MGGGKGWLWPQSKEIAEILRKAGGGHAVCNTPSPMQLATFMLREATKSRAEFMEAPCGRLGDLRQKFPRGCVDVRSKSKSKSWGSSPPKGAQDERMRPSRAGQRAEAPACDLSFPSEDLIISDSH